MRIWIGLYALLVGLGFAVLIANDAVADWDTYVGHYPDGAADKYTTLAAWDGSDPYVNMDELADRYGFHDSGWPSPHPRTPATFIIHTPLLAIPDAAFLPAMLFVTAGIVVACFWSARVDPRVAAVASLVALPPIYAGMVLYGSATMIVPALVALGWRWLHDRPRAVGIMLGVAAAVKLWPALIVAALILKRHRGGWWAVGTAAALTGAGLLLPGASVGGTVESMRGATGFFTGDNLSAFAAFGWPAVAAGIVLFGWGLAGSTRRSYAVAVLVALLVSPLSWAYYWLAAAPIVVESVTRAVTQPTLLPIRWWLHRRYYRTSAQSSTRP